MDIRALVDSAKAKGLSFYLEGDNIKVEAPTEPDTETKALLEELRGHREEVNYPDLPVGASLVLRRDASTI